MKKVVSLVVLLGALAGCSGSDPSADPSADSSTTPSASPSVLTEAEYVAAYEATCEASLEASADLEMPREDGGTWPPSPPKSALRKWAIYKSQLSAVTQQHLSALRALPLPESQDDRGKLAELQSLRQREFAALEAIVEAADAEDTQAFSRAYSDWVAAGAAAGRAEEKAGIDCRV
jgi:hypothetical protein